MNGIATFDLSGTALTASGNYIYTASLAGVTSATATETVAALDFCFIETITYQTVVPGSSAIFTYSAAPMMTGGMYPGPVVFTVSGLPTGATGTFSSGNTAFSSNTLTAGSGTAAITLTVLTSARPPRRKIGEAGCRRGRWPCCWCRSPV